MDPTVLVREVAMGLGVGPKSILIPIISSRELAIDDWTLSENGTPAESFKTLADTYDGEWDGTTSYFHNAESLLDNYVALNFDTDPFFLHLAANMIGEVGEDDVADTLSLYYEEKELTRPKLSADSLTREIMRMNTSEKDEYNATREEYTRLIAPIVVSLGSIDQQPYTKSKGLQTNVQSVVEYNDHPLSREGLDTIMRSIKLSSTITYASMRFGDSGKYQVKEGVMMEDNPPLPPSHNELLLLVTVGGKKNRQVILDASNSTIRAKDRDVVNAVIHSIPGLTLLSESSLESLSFIFSIDEFIPTILYYLIRMYEPWKTLMGVNDSQYARRDLRDITARVRRWAIRGSTILNEEELIPISIDFGDVVTDEGVLSGLSFTVKEVTSLVTSRVEVMITRLIYEYVNKKDEIIKLYPKKFSNLLIPIEEKSLSSAKILEERYPEVFGDQYKKRCKKRPTIAEEGDEGAVELDIDGEIIYVKCSDRYKLVVNRDGDRIIPCCIPITKRTIVNATTQLERGTQGFLFGIAPLFGKMEKSKKGTSSIVRTGTGKTFKATLQVALGKVVNRSFVTAPFLQCMWNYSEDEILEYLSRANWESDNVADGIALNLGVNIFVVELKDDKIVPRIPNYRFAYYLPFYYDRESIMIYRHPGREGVYELITPIGGSYKMDVASTSRTIEWVRNQYFIELVDRNGTYASLQDRGPYTEMNSVPPGVQIIDSYGKLRGYQDKGIIHYFPHPGAPLLGPHVRRGDSDKNREEYANVRLREGEAPFSSEVWKNLPMGNQLLALPISRKWSDETTTEIDWQINTVERYARLSRERLYILQLTNWIYANSQGEIDFDTFISSMLVDETVVYNFDFLPPDLGPYDYTSAIEYIQETGLGRILEDEQGKLGVLIYPSEGVKRGVIKMLKVSLNTHGDKVPIPNVLVGLERPKRSSYIDEKGILQQQIYLNSTDSYESLSTSIIARENVNMENLNDPRIRNRKYPFTIVSFTSTQERTRWLVQNVATGSYLRAVQCCANWLRRRKNTGYYTEQVPNGDEEIETHVVVYTWNESRILVSDTKVEGMVITILVYPGYKREGANSYKGHFAALLPLTPS